MFDLNIKLNRHIIKSHNLIKINESNKFECKICKLSLNEGVCSRHMKLHKNDTEQKIKQNVNLKLNKLKGNSPNLKHQLNKSTFSERVINQENVLSNMNKNTFLVSVKKEKDESIDELFSNPIEEHPQSHSSINVPEKYKPHICQICNRKFSRKCHLAKHNKAHNRELIADKKRKALNLRQLKVEITENEEDKYERSETTLQFKIPKQLLSKFQCDICLKYYCNKGNVARHRKVVHANKIVTKPTTEENVNIVCNICKMRFMRKHHYEEHYKSHSVIAINNDITVKREIKQEIYQEYDSTEADEYYKYL